MEECKQAEEKNIEEILAEMSECREDDRSAQNQMVQVIATAGTILTVIFGANIIGDGEVIPKSLLFHLSNLVFCTAIGYITTVGINSVLRYHYLQNLEDRILLFKPNISAKNAKQQLVHWMSFSAPVITRNPQHVKGQYTWMHYLCYTIATICAIMFCVTITIIQYLSLGEYSIYDQFSIGVLIVFFVFSMIVFFYSSYKAKDIYRFAKKISLENRERRLQALQYQGEENQKEEKNEKVNQENGTGFLKTISYFIYPKKKDLQKPFLLALGFVTGIFLYNDVRPLEIALKQFAIVFVAIDFLLYQARYQWNDIRGLREDRVAGRKDRLPKIGGTKSDQLSVKLSVAIMMVKIVSQLVVIFCFGGEMTTPLLTCSCAIILVAIFYEAARTKKKNWLIFFMVSLGYPLRFLAGIWSAHPEMLNLKGLLSGPISKIAFFLQQFWNNGEKGIDATIQPPIVALLLLAYALWGVASVILAWTHEAVVKKDAQKSYYKYLNKKVEKVALTVPKKRWLLPGNYLLSLRENGSLLLPWNWTYVASITFLSIIVCIVAKRSDTPVLGLFLASELITIVLSISIIVKRSLFQDWGRLCVVVFLIIITLKSVLFVHYSVWYLFYIYIGLTQFVFTLTYFFLRYDFNPDFDFVEIVKKTIKGLFRLIIGKDTSDFICSNGE